ncbi:S8 family serine peptidase [Bacillus manliponensis]|uniref:S8 family peptidase n=1 Tax=Bacillus manliponensis TaxID=574376 RepID=UPI00351603A1
MRLKSMYKISIILVIISILIYNIPHKSVSAEKYENQQESDPHLFVLKEDADGFRIFRNLELEFPNLELELIEEINIISVHSTDAQLIEEGIQYLESVYQNSLEEVGVNTAVELEEEEVPIQLTPFNLYSPMNTQPRTLDIPFSKWTWDIDKITSNRKSYEIEKGNHGVKIAIVDSGIDFQHPDLKENIIGEGKVFVPGVTSTQDMMGHGTMVAGAIAANGKMMGVSPHIGIVPYKVFDKGKAESSWIIEAIIQASKDKMDVINLSLGTYKSIKNPEERAVFVSYLRAINYAIQQGSILVGSSGTEASGFDISDPFKLAQQRGYDNDAQLHMPGGLANVITVSATDKDDKLASYSNYGESISVAAPAGDYGPLWKTEQKVDLNHMILTTFPTNLPQTPISQSLGFPIGYELMIGTSLAAPKVSATVGLIIAEYKERFGYKPSIQTVNKILQQGATPNGLPKNQVGHGIINAHNSLLDIQKIE